MRIILALVILMYSSFAYCSEKLVFEDAFEGATKGNPRQIEFTDGKDGQGVRLDHPGSGIEFSADSFAMDAGRINFDLKLTRPLTGDRQLWCLFSDIGAAASYQGAINVHWREDSDVLEYAIFDGARHHWCYSEGIEWEVGRWYNINLVYGPDGMRMEIDGKVTDTNPYAGGLANTAKRLGFHDGFVSAPPVIVDNFRTYRFNADFLRVSQHIILPKQVGFLDECKISYGVKYAAEVSLKVFDSQGRAAHTFVDSKLHEAGGYSITWDGNGLRDGEYTIKMTIKTADEGISEFNEKIKIDSRFNKQRPERSTMNDFFPIGAWSFWELDATYINQYTDTEKAKPYYEYVIEDMAKLNLNMFVSNWTPEHHRQIVLDEADKYGMKVIVHLQELNTLINMGAEGEKLDVYGIAKDAVKDVRNHPATLGYYLIDEPTNNEDIARRIGLSLRALENVDSGRPGLSCLLGGYEPLLEIADYEVLLVDIYPVGPHWNGDFSYYISELQRGMRNAGDRPLWVILQAFGIPNSWRIPAPEEIEAQVWLALAHGAKGIVYFIYQSTTEIQGERLQGVVDMELNPMDDRWEAIQRINADLKKIGSTILDLTVADFEVPVTGDIFAQGFTNQNGERYAILANKSAEETAICRWQGSPPTDMVTGLKVRPLIVICPGSGKLLKLE